MPHPGMGAAAGVFLLAAGSCLEGGEVSPPKPVEPPLSALGPAPGLGSAGKPPPDWNLGALSYPAETGRDVSDAPQVDLALNV